MNYTEYTIEELLDDLNLHHTELQIDNFILRKNGITKYGIYIQALREINNRANTIRNTKYEIDKQKIDIDELKSKPADTGNIYNDARTKLEIKHLESELKHKERNLLSVQKEFDHFCEIARKLKSQLGCIDKDKRLLLENEYWCNLFAYKIRSEVRTYGVVTKETLEAIDFLPFDITKKIDEGCGNGLNEKLLQSPTDTIF